MKTFYHITMSCSVKKYFFNTVMLLQKIITFNLISRESSSICSRFITTRHSRIFQDRRLQKFNVITFCISTITLKFGLLSTPTTWELFSLFPILTSILHCLTWPSLIGFVGNNCFRVISFS